MGKISKESTAALSKESVFPSVTIYLPTHKSSYPPHITEDQIRFKNLTHGALKKLEEIGSSDKFQKNFLAKSNEVLQDYEFWKHRTGGLLLCAHTDSFKLFDLPIDCEEYLAVDENYHLAPIYGLIDDNKKFYLLIVARHSPVLFKGDIYNLEPVKINLPDSIEDALKIDEMAQKSVQYHSTAGGSGAMYHSHGEAKDAGQQEELVFYRVIDRTIKDSIDTKLPLVLAGTADDISKYKEMTVYPHILDGYIKGSFSRAKTEELYPSAWGVVSEEVVEKQRQAALKSYLGSKPNYVSGDLRSIKAAAGEGKVDTLLIAFLTHSLSKIDANKSNSSKPAPKIIFSDSYENDLNDIARSVWSRSGKIVNLYQEQMPGGKKLLAIYRY